MSRPALSAFQIASRHLAWRWYRHDGVGPDWWCPQAVQAITMPLRAAPGTALQVVLREGVSVRTVPKTLHLGGHTLPLVALHAGQARAQAAVPPQLTAQRTNEIGTATALVRDRLSPERHYLLTCAHVVAPDAAARFRDGVHIGHAALGSVTGQLCEWAPLRPVGQPATRLDAALVELDSGSLHALRTLDPEWLPAGLNDQIGPALPVALQRPGGPLDGRLLVQWSGEVVTGANATSTYFLEDGLGYATASPTVAGDSGGALWSAGDHLLGMHIGALDPASAMGANALMTRVKPALDWFSVKPFTRHDLATLRADDWPALPAPQAPTVAPAVTPGAGGPAAHDLQVLARTLWGEARGDGEPGMAAVAAVVLNRWRTGYRGRASVAEVCLDPAQFSCWNRNDPNRSALERVAAQNDAPFLAALNIAAQALGGQLPDPTVGARHYVATWLRTRPHWLNDKRPCAVIGRHEFYNDIR
ncbi:MAG: cell wall hydrolase [Rubrivivax sp.]|nr:cell wall hydrolase [Rubrivivax sp.]